MKAVKGNACLPYTDKYLLKSIRNNNSTFSVDVFKMKENVRIFHSKIQSNVVFMFFFTNGF